MRAALPDELRAYMDGLGKDARTERIRLKRNVSADRGWAAMVDFGVYDAAVGKEAA